MDVDVSRVAHVVISYCVGIRVLTLRCWTMSVAFFPSRARREVASDLVYWYTHTLHMEVAVIHTSNCRSATFDIERVQVVRVSLDRAMRFRPRVLLVTAQAGRSECCTM